MTSIPSMAAAPSARLLVGSGALPEVLQNRSGGETDHHAGLLYGAGDGEHAAGKRLA